ncbi:MAG: excisionase family DNA binding protein [Psychroserpens sp.]|jgi:excisionase family DNA binding protein
MEQVLKFEQLPEAVTMLTREVSQLKSLLINRQEKNSTIEPEKLLNIQEAARFLNLSVPTIYSKVSKGELPVMKRSKRLYFSSIELMAYVKDGRKKSNAEIEAAADKYLSNIK